MDPRNTAATEDATFERLVQLALCELERLGCSRKTLRRYRTVRNRLIAFAGEIGLEDRRYSHGVAQRFVDARRSRDGEHVGPGEHWRRHVAFAVEVLGAFSRNAVIERSRTDLRHSPSDCDGAARSGLRGVLPGDRRHLRPTPVAEPMRSTAGVFVRFQNSRNVRRCGPSSAASAWRGPPRPGVSPNGCDSGSDPSAPPDARASATDRGDRRPACRACRPHSALRALRRLRRGPARRRDPHAACATNTASGPDSHPPMTVDLGRRRPGPDETAVETVARLRDMLRDPGGAVGNRPVLGCSPCADVDAC